MVSTGIYSLLPLGQRITAKIEQIIREEMDAIDGQEVLMPVVLPAELCMNQDVMIRSDRNCCVLWIAMKTDDAGE